LGIGDWGLGPIPNPQSPIPKIIYYEDLLYIKTLNQNKFVLNIIIIKLYKLIINK